MAIYKRILATNDFSDINQIAVERAASLAKQDGCELILLHVIEHFPMDGGPLTSVFQENTGKIDAALQQVRARMAELVDLLDYDSIRTDVRVTSKSARSEILQYAQANDMDLIIVAPHGNGVIGSLGSTASGVLNNASCDVLAVRESETLP